MAAFMTSSEFKDSLRAQLPTALSPQAATLPGLIEHLRIAEAEHAIDGWTALSAARGFIEKEVAEDLLQKTDFGSWRQVLHEAGVFEVRRESAEPGGAKETWYRSRHESRTDARPPPPGAVV